MATYWAMRTDLLSVVLENIDAFEKVFECPSQGVYRVVVRLGVRERLKLCEKGGVPRPANHVDVAMLPLRRTWVSDARTPSFGTLAVTADCVRGNDGSFSATAPAPAERAES